MTYVLSFDSQKQIKAKRYFYSSLVSSIAKKTLVSILTLTAVIFHIPIVLYNFITAYALLYPYALAIFVLIGYGLFLLITFPFNYFSEYALERKYALSTQSLHEWFKGKVKSSVITLILALVIIEIAYNFTSISPIWLLSGTIILSAFIICLTLTSSSFIENRLYNCQKLQDKELLSRFSNLALKSGLKKIQVYKMKTAKTIKAKAESSGTANGRKISLSDTLLENYSNDEIESIVGHEIGHHKNGHITKFALLLSLVMGAAFVFALQITQLAGNLLGLGSINSIAALPFLILTFALAYLVFTPVLNSFNRWIESKCDMYELELVQKPDAYVSSIIKLTDHNLRYAFPHRLIEVLFYDHPSSAKRLRFAL